LDGYQQTGDTRIDWVIYALEAGRMKNSFRFFHIRRPLFLLNKFMGFVANIAKSVLTSVQIFPVLASVLPATK